MTLYVLIIKLSSYGKFKLMTFIITTINLHNEEWGTASVIT